MIQRTQTPKPTYSIVPLETWLDHKPRPKGTIVDTVVLHATAGASLESDLDALRTRGLAYHYLIDHDGAIHKCVPAGSQCSHAGSSWGPHEQAKGVSSMVGKGGKFLARCSVNAYSIGVSFVNLNDGKQKITPAQIASAQGLIKELAATMPSIKWITTHRFITMNQEHKGRSRKVDPRLLDVDEMALKTGLEVWEPWPGAKDLPY